MMEKILREALIVKYQGEIAEAKANIHIYLNHSVGIGEHPDIIGAMDEQIEKMAHAEEKLICVRQHFIHPLEDDTRWEIVEGRDI